MRTTQAWGSENTTQAEHWRVWSQEEKTKVGAITAMCGRCGSDSKTGICDASLYPLAADTCT